MRRLRGRDAESSEQVSGLTKVQRVLGALINKIVIFTKDGPVVYSQTSEQRAQSASREAERQRTGACPAERRDCR